MKRLLSLVLSIVMACGLCAASAETDNGAAEYGLNENDIKVLSLAEIINEDEITNELLGEKITRANFLSYIAAAVGVSKDFETDKNFYVDMSGHWAENIASYFVQNGTLAVGESKLFEPDRAILADEALKIVVSVLGYSAIAEQTGGFPYGYIQTAKRIKLSSPSGNNELTTAQALSMIAQSLEIPCYDVESFSNDGYIKSGSNSEETLLSIYHSVFTDEGYVRAVNGISLDDAKCDDGEIFIGDYRYKSYLGYAENYLGSDVKVYYKAKSKNDKRTAEIIIEKQDNRVKQIDIENIIDLDSGYKLSVWKDDGSSSVSYSLDRGVTVIKNGLVEKSGIRDIISGLNNGTVRIADINRDGLYEYCIIKDYVPFILSYSNKQSGIIFDKLNGGSYSINDYEYSYIYDDAYSEKSIYDLMEDDVLSVAESSDKKTYIEVISSSKTVTGTVDEIKEVDNKKYFTVNGIEYEVNKTFLDKNSVQAGLSGSFKTDMFDIIVSFTEDSADAPKFGMLINAVTDEPFGTHLKLKIFGADGAMNVLRAADKIKINENSYSDMEKAKNSLINKTTGKVDLQIITYYTNENNEIKTIDTRTLGEKENADSTLRYAEPVDDSPGTEGVRVIFGRSGKRLGMSTYVNTGTVLFNAPNKAALESGDYSDEDFYILPYDGLREGKNVIVDAYYTKKPAIIAKGIITYGLEFGKGKNDDKDVFVVTGMSEKMNEDGEIKKILEGWDGIKAKKTEYPISEGLNLDLAEGDSIIIEVSNAGEISAATMIYDNSQGGEPNTQIGSTWFNKNRYFDNVKSLIRTWSFSFMYAGYKDGVFLSGFYDKDGAYDADDEAPDLSYCKVLIVDNDAKDGEKVYLGDMSDIRDAYTVGNENCSRVLMNYIGNYMRTVVVYL